MRCLLSKKKHCSSTEVDGVLLARHYSFPGGQLILHSLTVPMVSSPVFFYHIVGFYFWPNFIEPEAY
jgi:hypothetical protein